MDHRPGGRDRGGPRFLAGQPALGIGGVSSRHRCRRPLVLLVLAGLALLTVPGCAPSVPAPPSVAGIVAQPGLRSVAVYRFVDRRGQEPTRVGDDFFHGRTSILFPIDSGPKPVRVGRPVDVLVTEAFLAAFKARGFPVVDETARPFVAGQIAPRGAVAAVSGEVVRYWLESHTVVSGPASSFVTRGDCHVIVRLYSPGGGAPAFEKAYVARAVSGGRMDPGVLSEALGQVVWQATTDYELMKSLR